MNIQVPGPIATYLAAEKAKDVEMLDQCFREDAVVRDEGREHRGITAIKAWKSGADANYKYSLEPLEALTSGPEVVVRARVTGDFPSSPVMLQFHFSLDSDRITSLEVTP